MPLINCPECSDHISDRAAVCPQCGYPIKFESAKKLLLRTTKIIKPTPGLKKVYINKIRPALATTLSLFTLVALTYFVASLIGTVATLGKDTESVYGIGISMLIGIPSFCLIWLFVPKHTP